jgi:ubiquinone/menaquinone biosynthesis C-methylase UbiE
MGIDPSIDARSTRADSLKRRVRKFWEAKSCGEIYSSGDTLEEQLDAQAEARYALEPYIRTFAKFDDARGRDVLEIGVGMGADHLEWARVKPKRLVGIDLTDRGARLTEARMRHHGFTPRITTADAERLPFRDRSFDIVYSWGVLHHTPDTPQAIAEVWRVLRPGGVARIMIYHKPSIVGALLWLRYALLAGRPGRSVDDVLAEHLESPGTKAFSVEATTQMFQRFRVVRTLPALSFADLLKGEVGQRHVSPLLVTARALWPRWLIVRFFSRYGLDLVIDAVK